MITWQNFWMVALIVAVASFAAITVIVAIKGYTDLKAMLRVMTNQMADSHER